MIALGKARRARTPGMTAMIDVVFLLLVFFMLAARFGVEGGIELELAGQGGEYSGPPRLVAISPSSVELNGREIAVEALPDALVPLTSAPDDIVVVRPVGGATTQQVIDVMSVLQEAGFTSLALAE